MFSPRFVLFGGFLGAGKTTAIHAFAKWAQAEKGLKVGVLTNDQAMGLVDTALADGAKFAVREIGGGCFCCQSQLLVDALNDFVNTISPDLLIGEPVGSCTDLCATVLSPLRSVYKLDFDLAPLTVVLDPFAAERFLAGKCTFAPEVEYIFAKQLEEAQVIVINKCDVFDDSRLAILQTTLREKYPGSEIFAVSARTGSGLKEWWEWVLTAEYEERPFMPVDYDVYAAGEARLGWVNGVYRVNSSKLDGTSSEASGFGFDGNHFLAAFSSDLVRSFATNRILVAHFKIALQSSSGLAVMQWVQSSQQPEFTQRLDQRVRKSRLIINLRAQAEPEELNKIVRTAFRNAGRDLKVRKVSFAAFSPLPPTPTHRLSNF